jgi:NAD(P)-dependent dehydrogenase (short-subunit alcohol dehydrogenase family)
MTGYGTYRAGTGTPLVLLHGAQASWRIWRPVLPYLEPFHEVYAPTLPGHRGGMPIAADQAGFTGFADALEAQLDEAGLPQAHLAGNSLGGAVALELGQKGQAAYSASKAGLIGLMLPAARDLAQYGIRVVTIAPGLFDTGIFAEVDPRVVQALGSAVLNPSRLGEPGEFASLVMHIVENRYLNATTLSIDAGARLPNA